MDLFGEPRMRRRRARARRRGLLVIAGVAVIAAVVTAALVFHQDMDEARDHVSVRSRVVDSPWGEIEYADVGPGPPVLMIHERTAATCGSATMLNCGAPSARS